MTKKIDKKTTKPSNLDITLRSLRAEIATIAQLPDLCGRDAYRLISLAEAYLQIKFVTGADGCWHSYHRERR